MRSVRKKSTLARKNAPAVALKVQKFQLKGLGWCGEVTAHKLTPAQVRQVKAHAKENGEEVSALGGSMEDVVEGYNCYDTNLWQSGVLPFLHATRYALVGGDNRIIHSIDDLDRLATAPRSRGKIPPPGPSVEIVGKPRLVARKKNGNVLVYTEEHKGTTAVWEIESEVTPALEDLTFRLAKLRIADEDTLYVEAVSYKGRELERNYDEEMVVGKAAYSQLL